MVGPIGDMPTAAQRNAREEWLLKAAREAFPGWDFRRVFGGWEAVPTGTPVIQGIDLEVVMEKLRSRQR
jgi:hypothetical protein